MIRSSALAFSTIFVCFLISIQTAQASSKSRTTRRPGHHTDRRTGPIRKPRSPIQKKKATFTCGRHSFDSVPFTWCVDFGDTARNHDVIYNFHGSGGDEKDWQIGNLLMREEWRREHVPAPTAITVSFGDEWLLTDVPLASRPPLYPMIIKQVMPYMEAMLNGRQGLKGRRFLKGVSMGGFNGSQLLLKNGELFDRIALICPVMQDIGPYSTKEQITKYIEDRKGYINKEWVYDLVKDLQKEFPTQQDWLNHDPLELVKRGALKTPHVYISCADHDEYGFFEGAAEFARVAQSFGTNVTWHPTHGGHCMVDEKVLAKFFAP